MSFRFLFGPDAMRGLMQAMGGEVYLQSSADEGSRFRLELQRAAA